MRPEVFGIESMPEFSQHVTVTTNPVEALIEVARRDYMYTLWNGLKIDNEYTRNSLSGV